MSNYAVAVAVAVVAAAATVLLVSRKTTTPKPSAEMSLDAAISGVGQLLNGWGAVLGTVALLYFAGWILRGCP